jgi:archaeosine synthase beta-subunit
MTSQRNQFLDEIGKHLHRQRPRVPEGFNSTTYMERDGDKTYVDMYVRSRGCHHNHLGGCTMCDYWASEEFATERMSSFAQDALGAINFAPTLLVFGPSGSVFDEWEVPAPVRQDWYRLLRPVNASVYCLFARAETITESKLMEIAEYLDPSRVSIEMGLETADPWKLRHCINKAIELEQIVQAAQTIRKCGFSSCVYIMVGVPFLSAGEAVEDTVASIKWALEHDIDYCAVFPMHIKPWTVVDWLYQHRRYAPISLWAVVEVLMRFSAQQLGHIGICWHRPRPDQAHPLYEAPSLAPTTCPICVEQVLRIMDSYRFSSDRAGLVSRLGEISCKCKDEWALKLPEQLAGPPLEERVRNAYEEMGRDLLGADWWAQHGDAVLSGVPEYQPSGRLAK